MRTLRRWWLPTTSGYWSAPASAKRHLVDPGTATSDLATEAAKICLANRGIDASQVDAIIVATVTPDMMFPATACIVQAKLGATNAWGFDLSAACSGYLYAPPDGRQTRRIRRTEKKFSSSAPTS